MEAARIPARLLGLATMAEISNIWSGNYQSMTCAVLLQLAELRCAVASCDVDAEPILVVT